MLHIASLFEVADYVNCIGGSLMRKIILAMLTAVSAVLTTFNVAQSAHHRPPAPPPLCGTFKVGLNHPIPENYRCASDTITAQNWDKLEDPWLYKQICHGQYNVAPGNGAPNCHEMAEGHEDLSGNSIGGWTQIEGCPPASGANPVNTAKFWCGAGPAYTVQAIRGRAGNYCGYSWFRLRCF
jgi:hypothetical protein